MYARDGRSERSDVAGLQMRLFAGDFGVGAVLDTVRRVITLLLRLRLHTVQMLCRVTQPEFRIEQIMTYRASVWITMARQHTDIVQAKPCPHLSQRQTLHACELQRVVLHER